MPQAEALWSFSLLGILLLCLITFRQWRRRTCDYPEASKVKRRLPQGVRLIEKITLYAAVIVIGLGLLRLFASHHGTELSGAAGLYAAVGSFLIAVPVAALVANGVSWIVPPLRRANLAAMLGAKVSFASANRGLLLFAAVSVPIGMAVLMTAAAEPWAR